MPVKSVLVKYPILLVFGFCGCSSSMGFLDTILFLTWYIFPFDVAEILEGYFFTSCTVSPGQDWNYHFWIVLIHVDLNGINAAAWRYFTKYFWFVMWYELFVLCPMYLSRFLLLFSKGNIHEPLFLSLVPVNGMFSSFMVWSSFCVKTAFYPASRIFRWR